MTRTGPDPRDGERHRPRRQRPSDHAQRPLCRGRHPRARRGPVRHRPRHPAGPGGPWTSRSPPTTATPALLIGQWTAAQLDGEKATTPCLTCSTTRSSRWTTTATRVSWRCMGIDVADPRSTRRGATGMYRRRCTTSRRQRGRRGAEDGGRTAMEKCLTKNPTSTSSTRSTSPPLSAPTALEAAGKDEDVIVSVDGGCAGVEIVKYGVIGATAQQYPLKMAGWGSRPSPRSPGGGSRQL